MIFSFRVAPDRWLVVRPSGSPSIESSSIDSAVGRIISLIGWLNERSTISLHQFQPEYLFFVSLDPLMDRLDWLTDNLDCLFGSRTSFFHRQSLWLEISTYIHLFNHLNLKKNFGVNHRIGTLQSTEKERSEQFSYESMSIIRTNRTVKSVNRSIDRSVN